MTELWALSMTAGDVDASHRAAAAREMEVLGGGILLSTCHRAEVYGIGAVPTVQATRVLRGAGAASHLLRVASEIGRASCRERV